MRYKYFIIYPNNNIVLTPRIERGVVKFEELLYYGAESIYTKGDIIFFTGEREILYAWIPETSVMFNLDFVYWELDLPMATKPYGKFLQTLYTSKV